MQQNIRVVWLKAVFINVDLPPVVSRLWQVGRDFINPFLLDVVWSQVWFWEVTVVRVPFLDTFQDSLARVGVKTAGGQANPATGPTVVYQVTFSEGVSGFDDADVDLSVSSAGGPLAAAVTTVLAVVVALLAGSQLARLVPAH